MTEFNIVEISSLSKYIGKIKYDYLSVRDHANYVEGMCASKGDNPAGECAWVDSVRADRLDSGFWVFKYNENRLSQDFGEYILNSICLSDMADPDSLKYRSSKFHTFKVLINGKKVES